LARLIQAQLDRSGISGRALHERLTTDHFSDNRVPSAAKVARRIAGEGLENDWEFMSAVLDVCTPLAEQRAVRAELLRLRKAARENPTPVPDSVRRSELESAQRRTLAANDEVLRLMREKEAWYTAQATVNRAAEELQELLGRFGARVTELANAIGDGHGPQPMTDTELAALRGRLAEAEAEQARVGQVLDLAHRERDEAARLGAAAARRARELGIELDAMSEEVTWEADPSAGPSREARPTADPAGERDEPSHDATLRRVRDDLDQGAADLRGIRERLGEGTDREADGGVSTPEEPTHRRPTPAGAGLSRGDNPVTGGFELDGAFRPPGRATRSPRFDAHEKPDDGDLSDSGSGLVAEIAVLRADHEGAEASARLGRAGRRVPAAELVSLLPNLSPEDAGAVLRSASTGRAARHVPGLLALVSSRQARSILVAAGVGRPAERVAELLDELRPAQAHVLLEAAGLGRPARRAAELVGALEAAGRPTAAEAVLVAAADRRPADEVAELLGALWTTQRAAAATALLSLMVNARDNTRLAEFVAALRRAGRNSDAVTVLTAMADGGRRGRRGFARELKRVGLVEEARLIRSGGYRDASP